MNTVITDFHIAELSAPPPITTRYWYAIGVKRGLVGSQYYCANDAWSRALTMEVWKLC